MILDMRFKSPGGGREAASLAALVLMARCVCDATLRILIEEIMLAGMWEV